MGPLNKLQKMDKDAMKAYNTRLILSHIIRAQSISKGELARLTDLSVVSVSRITDEFIQRNLIQLVDSESQGSLGRPSKDLRLNERVLRALVIHIEREETSFGIVDSSGAILDYQELKIRASDIGVDDFLTFICGEIRRYLTSRPEIEIIPIVSIIIPGIVDDLGGTVRFSSVLRWQNIDLAAKMAKLMPGYRFLVENDIKAVAVAEMYFGLSRDCTDSVVLNVGDGVGAAVIIDNEIYRGQNNTVGEIGHIVTNQAGRLCECGQFGCLQTDIAEWAILQEAAGIHPDITIEAVFGAYQSKEPWAVKLINRVVAGISLAINLVVMAYSPQVVILYGSLIYKFAILRRLIQERYPLYVNEYAKNDFELKFSGYDRLGHLVGGAIRAIIENF